MAELALRGFIHFQPSSIDSSVYVSLGNYQLNTLSGLSASYIWFVGNGGLRIHHDGKSCR